MRLRESLRSLLGDGKDRSRAADHDLLRPLLRAHAPAKSNERDADKRQNEDLLQRMHANAEWRPVRPPSARYEKNRSVASAVHVSRRAMLHGATPD